MRSASELSGAGEDRPAGPELARDSHLPPPPCELGIVAAGRGDDVGWNPFLLGDDDGLVAVRETRMEGATDALVVKGVHSFLMNDRDVIAAVVRFLESGRFAN